MKYLISLAKSNKKTAIVYVALLAIFTGAPFQTGYCQKETPLTINAPTQLRVDLLRDPAQVYNMGYATNHSLEEIDSSDNHVLQYTAVKSRKPGLTWVVPDCISRQSAYQILVATSEEALKKDRAGVWNSGKISSAQNINVPYLGPDLKAGTVYYWKVRIWGKKSSGAAAANSIASSPYSDVQAFRTGDRLSDYQLPTFVLMKTVQKPKHQQAISEGYLLYDFGKDGFSQPRIKVNAALADTLSILLGERRLPDGYIDSLPPGTVRFRQILLPLMKGVHTYEIPIASDKRNTKSNAIKMPRYIGEVLPFRYLAVQGDLKHNKPLMVSRDLIHIPFNQKASLFSSSDSILNKVWDLCKYTIEATSFSGYYVDGDRERIPYEADALINQLSQYSTDASFNMAKRTLDYLIYNPTWPTEWSLQNPLIAYYDYMYSGDGRNLENIYTQLKAKVLTALEETNGLISTRTGKQLPGFLQSIHYKVFDGNEGLKDIVDWPHTPTETDNFVFTDYNAVVNAFYYRALISMSTIAQELQKPAEALDYKQKAANVKKAFTQYFVDTTTGLIRDGIGTDHSSLHANMFALAFGLVPKTNIPAVLQFIKTRGLSCSVYGAQFLLDALGQQDDSNYAIQLLTSRDNRSWYNMLQEGSTMTMEAWGQSFKPNQDWNHAWGTAPANYIVRYLMGIQPAKPGFREVQIKPHPGDLQQASIRYQTLRGDIQVSFQQDRNHFYLEVILPGNTTATIHLPQPKQVVSSAKSNVVITMDGQPQSVTEGNGYWIIDRVPSGKHVFTLTAVNSFQAK